MELEEIPTPDFGHLTQKDFLNIYEPSEDTFLLLDALSQDQHFIWNEMILCISELFFCFEMVKGELLCKL